MLQIYVINRSPVNCYMIIYSSFLTIKKVGNIFTPSFFQTPRWEDSYVQFCKIYDILLHGWVKGFYPIILRFPEKPHGTEFQACNSCGYLVTYQILVTPINRTYREKTFSVGCFPGSLKTKRKDKVKNVLEPTFASHLTLEY